jgi:hypothetical protein
MNGEIGPRTGLGFSRMPASIAAAGVKCGTVASHLGFSDAEIRVSEPFGHHDQQCLAFVQIGKRLGTDLPVVLDEPDEVRQGLG